MDTVTRRRARTRDQVDAAAAADAVQRLLAEVDALSADLRAVIADIHTEPSPLLKGPR